MLVLMFILMLVFVFERELCVLLSQFCYNGTDQNLKTFWFVLQVKVLFVRNLANGVTEELLETSFSEFGNLERVKKLKDYAFIHFEERDGAVKVPSAAPSSLGSAR